jgi:hypothetical protein
VAARLDGQHQDEPIPHWVRYDIADNRIDLRLDDGGTSSLWWATKNEWLGLLDVADVDLEALYANFDRSPLNDQNREYVFVRRPPPGVPHNAGTECGELADEQRQRRAAWKRSWWSVHQRRRRS